MIGVDLVYIPEFEKQLGLGGQSYLNRAFNADELANQDSTHLAGLWAAKEAVFKASPQDTPNGATSVAVTINPSGRPSATLDGTRYDVSISHHGEYAIAIAIRSNQ